MLALFSHVKRVFKPLDCCYKQTLPSHLHTAPFTSAQKSYVSNHRAKLPHLGCSQLVSQQHVRDEGEDGDDHRQSSPGVNTHGVQVLDGLEVRQFLFTTVVDLLSEMRLPVVELDDTNAEEDLSH